MRWRQIVPTAAFVVAGGYWAVQQGATLAAATAGAVGLYIILRWLTAWIFRTRYWYREGSRFRSTTCPDCGLSIRRQPGDWIKQCHRCGWTAGWPVVRWLTHSLPARQLRRTVVGPALVVVLVLGVMGLATAAGGGAAAFVDGDGELKIVPNGDGSGAAAEDSGINETAAEAAIIDEINRMRAEAGVPTLTRSEALHTVAKEHSQDMHDREFYAHTNPDGSSPYHRAPCMAAENIHAGELGRVEEAASGEMFTIRGGEDIAAFTIAGWEHSYEHYTTATDSRHSRVGVGVVVEDGSFYVTADFC